MKYYSTRNQNDSFNLSSAVLKGLASDGGLFIPEILPKFNMDDFLDCKSIASFSSKLLEPFFARDFLCKYLLDICEKTFSFPIPLTSLNSNTSLLELYHGPTAAFKDVGARFLANSMSHLVKENEKKTILVATSGDTGSAVSSALYKNPFFQVIIL